MFDSCVASLKFTADLSQKLNTSFLTEQDQDTQCEISESNHIDVLVAGEFTADTRVDDILVMTFLTLFSNHKKLRDVSSTNGIQDGVKLNQGELPILYLDYQHNPIIQQALDIT